MSHGTLHLRCETSKLTPLATHIFLECSPPAKLGVSWSNLTSIFQMGVSKNRGIQNGWFIMENPIKMDDLGVPLFSETSKLVETRNHQRKYRNPHLWSGGQRIGRILVAWQTRRSSAPTSALRITFLMPEGNPARIVTWRCCTSFRRDCGAGALVV